jgi:hypothetical protein
MTIRPPKGPTQTQTQTDRECLPKKAPDRPPPAGNGDCTFSDFVRSGPRVTFKIRCAEGVTGETDLVWTSDTYAGTTLMRGQGMENRIKIKGKKVGGDCDANAQQRKEQEEEAAAAQRAAEGASGLAGPQQLCAEAADGGEIDRFLPAEAGAKPECPDATRLCAALETRRGLTQLRQSGIEDGPLRIGKLCKKDVAALERRHCAALAKEPEAKVVADEESSEFLFASCPDLARSLAKRACAGRSFTGMSSAKRELCTRWAQEALQGR